MDRYFSSGVRPTYNVQAPPGPHFQNGVSNPGFPEVGFSNGSPCSCAQNMHPTYVVQRSPFLVTPSYWTPFPRVHPHFHPSDGFINRKEMKATQTLEQAENTHTEQDFPSRAPGWTSYGSSSTDAAPAIKLENIPRRADGASCLTQVTQPQGTRPPSHSLFNDTADNFGTSEKGEMRMGSGSAFPAVEHKGRGALCSPCGHGIDEPRPRPLREQCDEAVGAKDTTTSSAGVDTNLGGGTNGYGAVSHFQPPPEKAIPEIQLVKSHNNMRPEVCKSTDGSQFPPLRPPAIWYLRGDPRLPFLAQQNLSEPMSLPQSHCFLPAMLAQGSKVDKAVQVDSMVNEKQYFSSSDLKPQVDREPEAFAISPKEKVVYMLRNVRLEDLGDGEVEGDAKDDGVYEIGCFHEIKQGRLVLYKGRLYQEVGKVISCKSPYTPVTQGSISVAEESETTCGGIQKKPATALQESLKPKADEAVQCDTSYAGGAPELYEEDDIEVQDEYDQLVLG